MQATRDSPLRTESKRRNSFVNHGHDHSDSCVEPYAVIRYARARAHTATRARAPRPAPLSRRASAPARAPIRPVPRAEKSRAGIARAHRVGFSHHAPELRRGGDDGGAGLDGLARGGDLGAREEAALDGGDGGHRFGGWWCECGYAGAAARAEGFRIKPAGPRRALAASRRFPDRRSRVRWSARDRISIRTRGSHH